MKATPPRKTKLIDTDRLEKYGKVVKLSERKLFNAKDALF